MGSRLTISIPRQIYGGSCGYSSTLICPWSSNSWSCSDRDLIGSRKTKECSVWCSLENIRIVDNTRTSTCTRICITICKARQKTSSEKLKEGLHGENEWMNEWMFWFQIKALRSVRLVTRSTCGMDQGMEISIAASQMRLERRGILVI